MAPPREVPKFLVETNPAAADDVRRFWIAATRCVDDSPAQATTTWLAEGEARALGTKYIKGNLVANQEALSAAKRDSKAWRRTVIVHLMSIQKHADLLDFFFVAHQIRFAAVLTGLMDGLASGNFLVACSMIRSAIETVAWANQFVTKHVSKIPLVEGHRDEETEFFFKFHSEAIRALYPTRYRFERFDESGKPKGQVKTPDDWKYVRAEGTVDRTVSNILGAIDKLEVENQGAREMYDRICEFVHPNLGTLLVLTDSEAIVNGPDGIRLFRSEVRSRNPQLPMHATFMMPDMIRFCTALIQISEGLIQKAVPYRNAYRLLMQRVAKKTLKSNREYFDPYSDCLCGSGEKFKFCCGAR